MSAIDRVTVSLPQDLLREIDRFEKNRSRFIATAVRQELDRRVREQLRQSLENPHSETAEFAELGLEDWVESLPDEDTAALVDLNKGTPVQWTPGKGWKELPR